MIGPDTKYQMQWGGEWRPVVQMVDHNNVPTTLAMRAVKAVLWCHEPPDCGCYVPTLVSPGDIIERLDRDPNEREWEFI